MMTVAAERADARCAKRGRTLVCTPEAIWLWPATPLTERRSGAITALPMPILYRLAATLHGPAVHGTALARMVEHAAGLLNAGRCEAADRLVAAFPLPPVSFDGAALMKATARRLGVGLPDVEIAGWPSRTPPELFERLAPAYDHKRALAQKLEGFFDPGLRRAAPSSAPFDSVLHPRWPQGRPDGGQFRPREGSGAPNLVPVAETLEEREMRRAREQEERRWRFFHQLGVWQSQIDQARPANPAKDLFPSPASEDTPEDPEEGEPDFSPEEPDAARSKWPLDLPDERPTGRGAVSRWGRKVADAIGEAISNRDAETLDDIRKKVEEVGWLDKQTPNIISAQEPPRELQELNEAAQADESSPGFDDHHIIEQGDQNDDVPREIIDAKENIVRIARYAHWKVNAHYQTPRENLGWKTPREYLKGKSIEERRQYGLKVLRDIGVLK